MDAYAGRLLAERYRLPLPPAEEYELRESRAYDTASGQEVLVRQVPLPEVVEAELLGEPGFGGRTSLGRATRTPDDPAVRRAIDAALEASRIPDHPRLDQVFDVFVEDDGLWIVSELVAARPLAAVLAEAPLTPHRAAEIAADLLAALSAVHTYSWTHRNITTRTVLICEDGRALLTGLASGAAEEALSGYDPLPTDGPMAPSPPVRGLRGPAEQLHAEQPPGQGESGYGGVGWGDPEAGAENGGTGYGDPGDDAVVDAEAEFAEEWPVAASEVRSGAAPRDTGDGEATDEAPAPKGAHGPWGGDKPGPAMAIPVQLGYRPRHTPDNGPSADGSDRDGENGDGANEGSEGGQLPPAEDELGPLDFEKAPHRGVGGDDTDGTDGRFDPNDHRQDAAEAELAPPADSQTAPADAYGTPATYRTPDAYAETDPHPRGRDAELRGGHGGGEGREAERWGGGESAAGPYRGPVTSLAAERARQARMTMVGAVTERWAPEQAGPVYENWRLAPPVGPPADLWALGALLFRTVQGHAPYPEENTAELVQLVCAEPPAFAEECGPLRPVIESLLRQDPTERPSYEELSGWLRSLIRSAPEPDAGRRVVSAGLPPGGRRSDPSRLPIIRRRGELVRRRRAAREPVPVERRRHRKQSAKPAPRTGGGDPRKLGRLIVLGVFVLVVAVMVGAALLMPKSDGDSNQRGSVDGSRPAPSESGDGGTGGEDDKPGEGGSGGQSDSPEPSGGATDSDEPSAPEGYRVQDDPAGFRIAVPQGWARGQTSDGLVRFRKGAMELVVVPGRDSADRFGSDPRNYQLSDQPELADYRDATGWKTSSGVRTITVGDTAMAEGEFGWEAGGKQTVVRNRAMLLGGKYHVVLVKGPQSSREEVDEHFTAVVDTYRAGG
ncbi:serine/threonine protein kinase [Streptomyces sp. P38-E01]|uniref:Serine/threonine protein kinase n=1 Tax=Streptomyces tardus TaxID=2780544 RepID=A0A949N0L6_9ACTN|nr:serine/threonine protein kinase [Streptomyces tardus]MBU7596840.1 serine/threonine protein kinase [Streptomyces tardus]